MTTTSILNNELKVVIALIDTIEYDTHREYISESTEELEVNAYNLRFKVRVKREKNKHGNVCLREVYDLEMIYTDEADHEVILTPTQHAYACKELESKILITG